MPERKKSNGSEISETFLAYEVSLSPVILPLVLGFVGYYFSHKFNFPEIMGILGGGILGVIIGVKRLIDFLKKKKFFENK
ncbi:MAG: hypothetical protein SFU25_00895 [Candidatus Caenarcaniphilales bacterium]|nr:hypothetical protein [Candidatus Caenarcaniphilales bacterium]